MNNRFSRYDLRWVFVIVLLLLLLPSPLGIPYHLRVAIGIILGAMAINIGVQALRYGGAGRTSAQKVTYWRGQRIVLSQDRSKKSSVPDNWPALVGARMYIALGTISVLLALFSLLQIGF